MSSMEIDRRAVADPRAASQAQEARAGSRRPRWRRARRRRPAPTSFADVLKQGIDR